MAIPFISRIGTGDPEPLPPVRADGRGEAPRRAPSRPVMEWRDTTPPPAATPTMSDAEFDIIQGLFQAMAGIRLPREKKSMVCSRLARRLRFHRLRDFGDYVAMATDGRHEQELHHLVDLLTTHETYFFREPKHFELLRERILPQWPSDRPCRVWSAACSSGEEPYSLAMVLADTLGERADWEVLGTDIALHTLRGAENGLYSLERTDNIPADYLRRFCRKGVRSYSGTLLVNGGLREHTRFRQLNLTDELPADLGSFDIIFLRNVLIYFDQATKRRIIEKLMTRLRPGGWIFVGHAESLHGMVEDQIAERPAPAVYRKKEGR